MGDPKKIVVVEDSFVQTFIRTALERYGHEVVCAGSSHARDLMRMGEAALLITNKPAAFAEFGAAVPLLYTAAFPDPAAASRFERWLPLQKPFQHGELLEAVRELMGPV